MESTNFIIKLSEEHFTLLIPLKDIIIFDHILKEKDIKFYKEMSHETFGNQMYLYFFLNNDKTVVNEICIKEKINWLHP